MHSVSVSPIRFQGVKVKQISGGPGEVLVKLELNNEGTRDLDEFELDFPDRLTKGTNQLQLRSQFNPFQDLRRFEASCKNILWELSTDEKRDDYEFALRIPKLLEKAGISESIVSLINYTYVPVMERLHAIKTGQRMPDTIRTVPIFSFTPDQDQ